MNISISAFVSLPGIPIGITSSAIWLKICAIPAGIKKYKSIIKKKKMKHDRIVLLAKNKLNSIEVLISNASIVSNISHGKFDFKNNVLWRIWWYGRRNKRIKDLISISEILVYL